MTEQTNPPSSFWQGFGRFMRRLVRLALFALVVAVVVVAIYYAIPYVYSYTVLPVQNNRVLIDHVRRSQAQLQEDVTSQLADQRERMAQLEADLAAEREARSQLDSMLAQQAEAISAQATAQSELETTLQMQGQDSMVQTELATRFDSQAESITALEETVAAFDTSLAALNSAVADLEQAVTSPNDELVVLQQQILVLQASQALLKARLHLSENNPGQAQLVLEGVEQTLEQLAGLIPSEREADLSEIQSQLQTVVIAIDEQPFIAVQEIEILWELLQRLVEV